MPAPTFTVLPYFSRMPTIRGLPVTTVYRFIAREKTARKTSITINHQNRLYPKLAPAFVEETMEPGPMEVAARMKPGPSAARKYFRPLLSEDFVCSMFANSLTSTTNLNDSCGRAAYLPA